MLSCWLTGKGSDCFLVDEQEWGFGLSLVVGRAVSAESEIPRKARGVKALPSGELASRER